MRQIDAPGLGMTACIVRENAAASGAAPASIHRIAGLRRLQKNVSENE
jgi:hypothetical protein